MKHSSVFKVTYRCFLLSILLLAILLIVSFTLVYAFYVNISVGSVFIMINEQQLATNLNILNNLNISNPANPGSDIIKYNCSLHIIHNKEDGHEGPAASFLNGFVPHFLRDKFSKVEISKDSKIATDQEIVINVNNNQMLSILIGPEHCDGINDFNKFINHNSVPIAYVYHNSNRSEIMGLNWKLFHFPLFFRMDFGDFETQIWPMINNISYITSRQRLYFVAMIMSIHTGNRKNFLSIWNKTKEIYGLKAFVYLIKGWEATNNNNNYLSNQQYRNILYNTRFVVCAAGNNPQTFRFWEALSCGAIPIIALWETKHGFIWKGRFCNDSYDAILDIHFYKYKYFTRLNTSNFYWHQFDVQMLHQTVKRQTFRPFIVLNEWEDLLPFLQIASTPKNNEFWITFQKFTAFWIKQFIHDKMSTLTLSIVQRSMSGCVPVVDL